MPKEKVSDVFKISGQPTTTYVKRRSGYFERQLRDILESQGQICLITGISKTGKTALYNHVLGKMKKEPLVVRCDGELTATQFWTKALESIKFDRVASTSNTESSKISGGAKIKGSVNWAWLANIIGEVSLDVTKDMGETEIRKKILAQPSPQHLIPALAKLPFVLIVEDFQHLSEKTKKTIFQQWKVFTDNEISVALVTTHSAVDIQNYNPDLIGSVTEIELDSWDETDLMEIATLGFHHLSISLPDDVSIAMAKETVGLPIIMQHVCLQLFVDRKLKEVSLGSPLNFEKKDVYEALHNVAVNKYALLDGSCRKLNKYEPRSRLKYEHYRFLVAIFAHDPLVFSLRPNEIELRLNNMNIRPERQILPTALERSLDGLKTLQSRVGLNLLEWSSGSQKLYIRVPEILFYARWRTNQTSAPEGKARWTAIFADVREFLDDSPFDCPMS